MVSGITYSKRGAGRGGERGMFNHTGCKGAGAREESAGGPSQKQTDRQTDTDTDTDTDTRHRYMLVLVLVLHLTSLLPFVEQHVTLGRKHGIEFTSGGARLIVTEIPRCSMSAHETCVVTSVLQADMLAGMITHRA